jgi:carbon monoxide dehydrogenase subunit G
LIFRLQNTLLWGEVSGSEIRDPICRIVRATRFLFVLLALLARSAAAATVSISLANRADTIEIEGSAELNADAETAWRVLTDYERYVDFIPGLQESRVVARNGAIVTVEETGDVKLWQLHMPLDVTFEITEMAPTGLVSRVVAGDLRALNSRYALTPVGNGVRLEYTGKLGSGLALFGAIERLAVKENVALHFQALADEIERRSAAARDQSSARLSLKA